MSKRSGVFEVDPAATGVGTLVMVQPEYMTPEQWWALLPLGLAYEEAQWVICSALPRAELDALMLPFWRSVFQNLIIEVNPRPQIHFIRYWNPAGLYGFHGYIDGQEVPPLSSDPLYLEYRHAEGAHVSFYPGEFWQACGMMDSYLYTANWAPLFNEVTTTGMFSGVEESRTLPEFLARWPTEGHPGGFNCLNRRIVLALPSAEPPGYSLTGLLTQASRS